MVTEGYRLFDNSEKSLSKRRLIPFCELMAGILLLNSRTARSCFAGMLRCGCEEQLRRIQIRETILSHIERERQLFSKGIKVLSLFFIDEVAKYKQYDENGNAQGGTYADIFEEEYKAIVGSMQLAFADLPEYLAYLDSIDAERTHAGYFSIDKKSGRMIDSKLGDKKERTSDDADAYDLIMKDKERLLDRREPVRFIFSHSALREGWDIRTVFDAH